MTSGYLEYPDWLSPIVSQSLPLRWYGLLLAAAVVASWCLFALFAHEHRLIEPGRTGRDQQARFFAWVLIGALVGARLVYVLSSDDWRLFLSQPWRLIWPFADGEFTGIEGFNEFGAMGGAAIAVLLFSWISRVRVVLWADALAVTAPVFTLAARLGNFANREFLGRVATVPWAVQFPNAERFPVSEQRIAGVVAAAGISVDAEQLLVNLPRHPVQLYEALLAGVLLGLLVWFFFRSQPPFPGALTGLLLTGHGALGFLLGYYREAEELLRWTGAAGDLRFVDTMLLVTPYQLVCLAVAIAGICICVTARAFHSPPPVVATYEESQTE